MIHRFPCGGVAVEMTREVDGISITECVGPLPDEFRTMHYGPVVHPELPDGGGTDGGFLEFIAALRSAAGGPWAASVIAGAAIK